MTKHPILKYVQELIKKGGSRYTERIVFLAGIHVDCMVSSVHDYVPKKEHFSLMAKVALERGGSVYWEDESAILRRLVEGDTWAKIKRCAEDIYGVGTDWMNGDRGGIRRMSVQEAPACADRGRANVSGLVKHTNAAIQSANKSYELEEPTIEAHLVGSSLIESEDKSRVTFGKYKGWPISEVPTAYLKWMRDVQFNYQSLDQNIAFTMEMDRRGIALKGRAEVKKLTDGR